MITMFYLEMEKMSEQKMSELKQREEHLEWLKRKSETARLHFDLQMLGRSTTEPKKLVTIETDTEANKNTQKAKDEPTTNQDINLQEFFEDMERVIQ